MWVEILVLLVVALTGASLLFWWVRSRGDEVGRCEVRAHELLGPRHATVSVRRARRGAAVIVATRISMGLYLERLSPRDALELAAVLEKAADCCPGS